MSCSADIVLINPAPLRCSKREKAIRSERTRYRPIGLLTIAGHLLAHGYTPAIVDLQHEDLTSKSDFQRRLCDSASAPLLVGITVYTDTCQDALAIAMAVREVFPDTVIVLGGPHASFCFRELLVEGDQVDLVVRGEGESTIVEFLEYLSNPGSLDLSAIDGLAFRTHNGIACTRDRRRCTNLDCLPLPPHHLIADSAEADADRELVLMSSRGCPGRCIFCASRALSGNRYRSHSPERLISEILLTLDGAESANLSVLDDTFLVDHARLHRFCELLGQVGLRIKWTCRARVDSICDEIAELIAASGCWSVHIGVESGDDLVLAAIAKSTTVRAACEAIFVLKKHGIRPECSFIIGHHADSLASIERTVCFAKWVRDNRYGLSVVRICTPLPGTRLIEGEGEYGMRFLTRNWRDYDLLNVVFETPLFTAQDIKRAQYHFEVESVLDPSATLGFCDDSCDELRELLDGYANRIGAIALMGCGHESSL